MKLILLISVITLFQEPDSLLQTEITERISIGIPADFVPMSDFERQRRVVSYRKPLGLYTDPNSLIDLGINNSYTVWSSNDLELLSKFLKSSLINMYSKIEFIDEGITEVNGRDFVFFEFISSVDPPGDSHLKPIRKYTLIYYTLDSAETLLFNFTCPQALQSKWQQIAADIMNSILIKVR